MSDIEKIVNVFCCVNGLSVKLSYDMPSGYETAYGTYDVTINTWFLMKIGRKIKWCAKTNIQ